jgi:heptosyltransferase-2
MSDIDLSKLERILVIMMGGIGNMIFLTPALKALRKTYPDSKIGFLLGPYGAEKVIERSALIDKKIIVDLEKNKGISRKIKLVRALRRENFSLSITSTGTNPLKSGLLCYLAGIKYRMGEDIKGKGFFYNLKVAFDENRHEVEGNLNLIQKLGREVKDKSLYIHRSPEDKNFARKIFADHDLEGKLVIGMHPGSGIHQAGFKRWPKEKFALLADRLVNDYNASVIIFGGAEETDLASDINRLMKNDSLIMTGKTTLGQAAALIEKCSLFISNDSGLLHVACAVNPKTIGIYGPTDYKRTGPFSNSAVIVRKGLDCSPCYKGKKVECSGLDCLELITVEEVLEAVGSLLRRDKD